MFSIDIPIKVLKSDVLPEKGDIVTIDGLPIGAILDIDYEREVIKVRAYGEAKVKYPFHYIEVYGIMPR